MCWSTRSISTAPSRRGASAAHLGPQFVVTNSLTKVYGLSGLRCGWILAEPELAERMWRLNDLFGVNQAHQAERLACIAFDHLDEVVGGNAERCSRAIARIFNDFVAVAQRPRLHARRARHHRLPALGRRRHRAARCTCCARNMTRRSCPAAGSRCRTISASASAGRPAISRKGLARLGAALDELQ